MKEDGPESFEPDRSTVLCHSALAEAANRRFRIIELSAIRFTASSRFPHLFDRRVYLNVEIESVDGLGIDAKSDDFSLHSSVVVTLKPSSSLSAVTS
jgi:hypothetical protein